MCSLGCMFASRMSSAEFLLHALVLPHKRKDGEEEDYLNDPTMRSYFIGQIFHWEPFFVGNDNNDQRLKIAGMRKSSCIQYFFLTLL